MAENHADTNDAVESGFSEPFMKRNSISQKAT